MQWILLIIAMLLALSANRKAARAEAEAKRLRGLLAEQGQASFNATMTTIKDFRRVDDKLFEIELSLKRMGDL